MQASKLVKVGGVAAVCAAVGAGGAYVGSASSPSASSAATAGHAKTKAKRHAGLRVLRRAVHADAVVPAKGGKFVTLTLDRGIVVSVNGNQLTLKEGTPKATYKTLSLDIPSGAIVRVNRKPASLSDVKPGQLAIVVKGPSKTRVLAHDKRQGGPPHADQG